MIEPTDEMVRAFTRHFFTCFRDSDVREALAAVLAVVERDYRVVPRCPDVECERCAPHSGNHGCFDGREWVAW